MTTVYWGHSPVEPRKFFELLLIEPTLALSEIADSRDISNPGHFVRCPAFKEYYKNTYVIKSPVDIEISYNPMTKQLHINPQNQAFYDANIVYRGDIIGERDDFLMSFFLNYLFLADKDCHIELIQAFMHKSDFIDKTRVVSGSFNINKWYRPVEVAFEIKNHESPIKIKRGDALAYVRFRPEDNKKIELQFKNFSEEVKEAVGACLQVKNSANRISLNGLYELSKRVRDKLWFNKKKCPFNWRKK